jgi:hypothetical protein
MYLLAGRAASDAPQSRGPPDGWPDRQADLRRADPPAPDPKELRHRTHVIECASDRSAHGWPCHTRGPYGLVDPRLVVECQITAGVVIIGGGSGMGLALARSVLAEGMGVTIAGRSADRLAVAQAELQRFVPGMVRMGCLRTSVGRRLWPSYSLE